MESQYDNNKKFDYIQKLKEICEEIEGENEFNVEIILKKILFYTAIELSTFFCDNVFVLLKIKFCNFSENKSYEKVLEDIFYQISKNFKPIQYLSVVNLFETLQLGNFQQEAMVFFIKNLLVFYFVHLRIVNEIQKEFDEENRKENGGNSGGFVGYEEMFGRYFEGGLKEMSSLLKTIPLIEFIDSDDKSEENYIKIIFKITENEGKIYVKSNSNTSKSAKKSKNNSNELIESTMSNSSALPPVKIKSKQTKAEHFFTTELSKNNE